jgi:hypothetical protein
MEMAYMQKTTQGEHGREEHKLDGFRSAPTKGLRKRMHNHHDKWGKR